MMTSSTASLSTGPAGSQLDLEEMYGQVQTYFERQGLAETIGLGQRAVELIALDWLALDGKRWRPFLAVAILRAVYDGPDAEEIGRRIAISLECIHKASLIYDDIQDGDDCRYGAPTVHLVHGVPLALTASLLLMGHGYRMLAELPLPPRARAELLVLATQGHCDLCLGQGSELAWMRDQQPLTPAAVLDIFRLKTAPSFDVVFRLPLIAAGIDDKECERLRQFCSIIGTAYQINDDLDDFHGGGDVDDLVHGRPSIVLALAHAAAAGKDRALIAKAWCESASPAEYAQVKELLGSLGAAEQAAGLLAEQLQAAKATIASVGDPGLRQVLHRCADLVFARLAALR